MIKKKRHFITEMMANAKHCYLQVLTAAEGAQMINSQDTSDDYSDNDSDISDDAF
jgi:hypothetical protein